MKKNVLLLASVVFAMHIPSGLSAELLHDSQNRIVRGSHHDKKEIMMSPGTYKFTLNISGEGRNPNPKFVIKQKTGSGLATKTLYESHYGTGTHEGIFEVEAKRTSDASASAAARGSYTGISASGAAEGDLSVNTALVDANRKVIFKVRNPVGKRRITYRLKIYRDNQVQVGAIEQNTDRMGSDYNRLENLPNASVCQRTCKEDTPCVAWTFVKPNTIQGPKSQCYLKNSVPNKTVNNACDSGVIYR